MQKLVVLQIYIY